MKCLVAAVALVVVICTGVAAQTPKAADRGGVAPGEKPKVYADVKLILSQIPKEHLPPAGKPWDKDHIRAFNDWMKDFAGAELQAKARRKDDGEGMVNGKPHDNMWVTTTPPAGTRIGKVELHASFRQELGQQLWATKPGVNVNVRGKVTAIQIKEAGPVPTATLVLSLDECSIER